MDTVTEAELAVELSRVGGFGVFHRFLTAEEQAGQVEEVRGGGEQVGAEIGIGEVHLSRPPAHGSAKATTRTTTGKV